MFDSELFLGFPVDPLFAVALGKTNPFAVKQFLGGGDYLTDLTHNDMRYLGKFLGKISTLPQLELVENNVYSLLKRVVPNFPYQETPLYLFTIIHAPTE